MGMAAGEVEAYSTATEARFDQSPVLKQTASPSPVLLAPLFYGVVTRMSELSTLIADQATTQLTASPASSPTPSATARPSASPSPAR
jgi:hypothetical protein